MKVHAVVAVGVLSVWWAAADGAFGQEPSMSELQGDRFDDAEDRSACAGCDGEPRVRRDSAHAGV